MPPTDDQTAPPSAAAAASPPPGAPGTSAAESPELAWELDVPLLTNRFILYDMLKVVGLSGLIFYALLAVVLTVADRRVDFKLLGTFGLVSLLVVLGMLGLLILVMGLFFLNRFPMGFRLTPKGAVVESLSRRGQVANRLAVILGALAGRPGVAGAGLLGVAQEVVAVDWQDVRRVKVHPGPRVISLMNSWRVVLRLYCLPENFAAVLPAVEAWAAAGSRPPRRVRSRAAPSPFPRLLLLSGGLLLAGLSLWALPLSVPDSLKYAALAAALLTLWVPAASRFFGVLTLAAALFVAGNFIVPALESRAAFTPAQEQELLQAMRRKGHDLKEIPPWLNPKHRRFQIFRTAEWLGTGVGALGLAYLAWLGLAGVRRRPEPQGNPGSRPPAA